MNVFSYYRMFCDTETYDEEDDGVLRCDGCDKPLLLSSRAAGHGFTCSGYCRACFLKNRKEELRLEIEAREEPLCFGAKTEYACICCGKMHTTGHLACAECIPIYEKYCEIERAWRMKRERLGFFFATGKSEYIREEMQSA